jgi:tetratricopeptide (TPR) repeat protein
MGRLPLAIMLVAVLVGACAKKGGDGGPSPASTDAQPAPPASGANGASGANAAGSDSQAGAATAPAKGAAADKAAAAKHLKAGRALAKKKEWKAAVAELQQATAAAPDEPAAWSELGWTAFQADDLDLAESANRKAVELATADKHKGLKAASPYNLGRIAEKRPWKTATRWR